MVRCTPTRRGSVLKTSSSSLEVLSPEAPTPPSGVSSCEKRSPNGRRVDVIKEDEDLDLMEEVDDTVSMMTAQEGEAEAAFMTEVADGSQVDEIKSNYSLSDDDLEMYTVGSAPTAPESIACSSAAQTPSLLVMQSKRIRRRHIPFRAAQPTASSKNKTRDLIKEREDSVRSKEGIPEVTKVAPVIEKKKRVHIKEDIIIEKSSQPLLTESEEMRVEEILSSDRFDLEEGCEPTQFEITAGEGFCKDEDVAAAEVEIEKKLQAMRPDLDISALTAPVVITENHRTSKELSDMADAVHEKLNKLYLKAAEEEEGLQIDLSHDHEGEYQRRLPATMLSKLLETACREQGRNIPAYPTDCQPDMERSVQTPIPIHQDIGSFEEGDSPMEPEKLFYNTMSVPLASNGASPEPDDDPPPPSYGEAVKERNTDSVQPPSPPPPPPCDILFFNIDDNGDEKPEEPIITIPKERKLFLDGDWDSLLSRTPEGFLNRPNSSCSLLAAKVT
eukprot:TRINITY_DN3272_c0_g1_i1.p1 TRINITY_DN3272_c0_g1~~TRINITY_DN3272_c0_g1_i1.p1  ORF type:complete len:501 (+),score=147.11 TRINITY_DN3272_c0_g1_i1:55-1557(+)